MRCATPRISDQRSVTVHEQVALPRPFQIHEALEDIDVALGGLARGHDGVARQVGQAGDSWGFTARGHDAHRGRAGHVVFDIELQALNAWVSIQVFVQGDGVVALIGIGLDAFEALFDVVGDFLGRGLRLPGQFAAHGVDAHPQGRASGCRRAGGNQGPHFSSNRHIAILSAISLARARSGVVDRRGVAQ